MYVDRLAKLRAAMARDSLDAVTIMPTANLRYLTNLPSHPSKRLTLAIFPVGGDDPCMVLPMLEAPRTRSAAGIPLRLFTWSDSGGPLQALRSALGELPLGRPARIGVEYNAMRLMELRALEDACAQMGISIQAVDASPLLASMRMVKDGRELAAMEEAVRIVEMGLHNTIRQIAPGMTERQLARVCTNEIISAGAEGESFDAFVASGPNSANPHHSPSDRPFQAGDLITIDCGAVYEGYASDITRTVALGEPGAEARRMYEVVYDANRAGRASVHPGVAGEEIDRAARKVITDAGYGEYFLHRTGHGLGLETYPPHEPPNLVAGSTEPLSIGTTLTIEPGIYIEGVCGVRIEDDVVITADGSRTLTSFKRELITLAV